MKLQISAIIVSGLVATSAATETTTRQGKRALNWDPDCMWQGDGYDEGERAYDCNAKYHYCECVCSWTSQSNCYWSNCGYDWGYCNAPPQPPTWDAYNEYTNAVCWRKLGNPGNQNEDYYKYTLDFDDCNRICSNDSSCRAFYHDSFNNRCEIWVKKVKYVESNKPWYEGQVCYTKVSASSQSATPDDPDADENGIVLITNTTEPLEKLDELDSPNGPATPIEGTIPIESDVDQETELDTDPEAEIAASGDSTSSATGVHPEASIFALSAILAGLAGLTVLVSI